MLFASNIALHLTLVSRSSERMVKRIIWWNMKQPRFPEFSVECECTCVCSATLLHVCVTDAQDFHPAILEGQVTNAVHGFVRYKKPADYTTHAVQSHTA
jgi:hypothetical protein